MNKAEYRNYLKSDHWLDFKTKVRQECGCNSCGICGSTYALNIHHLNYERLWKEKLTDVIVLCKNCHKKLHNGEIPPDILKNVTRYRKLFKQPYKKNVAVPVKKKTRNKRKFKHKFKGWKERKSLKPNSIRSLGSIEFFRRQREGLPVDL